MIGIFQVFWYHESILLKRNCYILDVLITTIFCFSFCIAKEVPVTFLYVLVLQRNCLIFFVQQKIQRYLFSKNTTKNEWRILWNFMKCYTNVLIWTKTSLAFFKKVKNDLENASSREEQIRIIYDYVAYKKKLDTTISWQMFVIPLILRTNFMKKKYFMDENT